MTAEHGYGRYTRGCRCDVCRKAKADYMRARRATARALAAKVTKRRFGDQPRIGLPRRLARGVKHGTRFAYEEHGCRCWPCTTARSASDARYRQEAS